MKVNGYEIWDEPTREEFETYRRVRRFVQQERIAGWLDGMERLEQGEFWALCEDFEDLSFRSEEYEAVSYLHDLIIKAREHRCEVCGCPMLEGFTDGEGFNTCEECFEQAMSDRFGDWRRTSHEGYNGGWYEAYEPRECEWFDTGIHWAEWD